MKYRETIVHDVDAVHWTGDSIELAKLVGAPVTVQPNGTATWPTPDGDEDFGSLPPAHVGVKYADGSFEAIPVADFTKRFKKIIGPRAPKETTVATPPPSPGGGE